MTPRYRLRTLLIVLTLLPPIVAMVVPPLLQWLRSKSPADMPVARVYPLRNVDPAVAARTVKVKLPGITMAIDSSSVSLFVAARPTDHAAVEEIIKELDKGPPTSTSADRRAVKLKPSPEASARP